MNLLRLAVWQTTVLVEYPPRPSCSTRSSSGQPLPLPNPEPAHKAPLDVFVVRLEVARYEHLIRGAAQRLRVVAWDRPQSPH